MTEGGLSQNDNTAPEQGTGARESNFPRSGAHNDRTWVNRFSRPCGWGLERRSVIACEAFRVPCGPSGMPVVGTLAQGLGPDVCPHADYA